jgi:hypothetical protein
MNLNRITTKMFWILRRTGAVNFFNSINNNYSSKSNSNNPHTGKLKLSFFIRTQSLPINATNLFRDD